MPASMSRGKSSRRYRGTSLQLSLRHPNPLTVQKDLKRKKTVGMSVDTDTITFNFKRVDPNGAECVFLTQELHEFVLPMMGSLRGPTNGNASRPFTLPEDSIYMLAEASQPLGEGVPHPNHYGGIALLPHHPGRESSKGLPQDEKVGEIKRAVVRAQSRRTGLGTKLLAAIEEEAKKEGYAYLVVETLHQMEHSQKFYQKNGYSPRDCFGAYSDEDSVFYEKRLER